MNLRHKVVNSIAIAALTLGMTGGITMAQGVSSSTDEAEVNVICVSAPAVSVALGAAFQVDLLGPTPTSSNTVVDAVTITVNLNCATGPMIWHVGTGVGTFNHDGPVQSGKAASFSGNTFKMTAGDLVSFTPGPTATIGDNGPVVIPNVYPNGIPVLQDTALADAAIFNTASAGVSVADWDAQLTGLPTNLATGTYKADMTVVLYIP